MTATAAAPISGERCERSLHADPDGPAHDVHVLRAVSRVRQFDQGVRLAVLRGPVFFLLRIPLLRGRWRPRDARRDE